VVARTTGLSIYEDLKLKKRKGESSGAVRKGAFKQLTGQEGGGTCLAGNRSMKRIFLFGQEMM
jgi:hypothetical protein